MNIDFEKTALLIIDMQKAFVEPEAVLCIRQAKATVPAISQLADHLRSKGAKVIWVIRHYAPDGSDMEIPRRKTLAEKNLLGILAPESTGINSAEMAEGLVPDEKDTIMVKPRFSSFFGTRLDRMLREDGIDTIILTGTTTPNCIRATAYDGISYDYRTIVVNDCCSSNTDEIQRVNMADMQQVGCEIITKRDLIDAKARTCSEPDAK